MNCPLCERPILPYAFLEDEESNNYCSCSSLQVEDILLAVLYVVNDGDKDDRETYQLV